MGAQRGVELSLLDQVPFAVAIVTSDGMIGYWNKGAETLFGWPRRDVVRRPLEELAAPGPGTAAVREALEAVTSGGLWDGRVSLHHRSGDILTAELRCSPLQNAAEDTIGVIVVALDASMSRSSEQVEATHLGRRIARARKEAGLTQQELADRVGVTRRSIQGYESGSIAPYRHLEQLAEGLGRTRQWLVGAETGNGSDTELPAALKAELRGLIRDELVDALRDLELAAAG